MKFGRNKYGTQLIIVEEKYSIYIHDVNDISVDKTFMKMKYKKGIKRHGKISISAMYKVYKELEDKKVMRELEFDSITKS